MSPDIFALPGEPPVEHTMKRLEGARLHNLPPQPTPLIGREHEVEAVCQLVRSPKVRLLTLVGPPGIGKTRLSLQCAIELLDDFPNGICFVPLAPVSDSDLLVSAIAQALALREAPNKQVLDSLKSYLQTRQLLLLLDNFEQVVTAAPLLAELLAGCSGIKMLVTSRELLHLYGEYDYPVPPLSLPEMDEGPRTKDEGQPESIRHSSFVIRLAENEAVRLFVQRAQAVNPGFELTNHNARAVAEICLQLDGLPLALELAAARTLVLPPEELLARLTGRLKLLTGGARNLPERHRTLQAAIDWSYNLLEPGEQALFRRLGVVVGGCTLEAIEEVCGSADSGMDILDGVTSLVGKSLLRRQDGATGHPRFMMLETIREYAREKLQESGEAADLGRRHAQYFLQLAEEGEPKLKGPQQVEWLDRLEEDHNNVRAALDWSQRATPEKGAEIGLHLARALWHFWEVRGYLTEGREWLTRVLSHYPAMLPATGDERRGVVQRARAGALDGAARLAFFQGDYTAARRLAEESVELFREWGDKANLTSALSNLGHVLMNQGDFVLAQAANEETLAIHRELGDRRGIAVSLTNLGLVAACRGDYERARSLLDEGLALFRQLGNKEGTAYVLRHLGFTAHSEGNYEQAGALLKESLILFRQQGNKRVVAECLAELAAVTGIQGQPEPAARLFGAAQELYEALGATVWDTNRSLYERDLATTRAKLDKEVWEKAWAEGRTMSPDEAIAYALEPGSPWVSKAEHVPTAAPGEAGSPIDRQEDHPYPNDLTEREVDVLRLIAAGRSNQEIAQDLVLSLRTVERHISNIYQKVGATGKVARATVTAFALRHGLIE